MIAYAAIVPHSPMLVPALGRGRHDELKKTATAMRVLADELLAQKVSTIIIFSSHMTVSSPGVYINVADSYELNFNNFGEFSTAFVFSPDMILAANLLDAAANAAPVVSAVTLPMLDVGCTTPLATLIKLPPVVNLLPVGSTVLDLPRAYAVGKTWAEQLRRCPQRVALIASANLSHRLNKTAPGGYSRKAGAFDEQVLDFIEDNAIDDLLRIGVKTIDDVAACGLSPIALMFGALTSVNYTTRLLQYEAPFGVGHLTCALMPHAL